ncbi:MAG TPA: hypothetical protein VF519_12570 [Mycobacteriales bacterium]|jgi:hypothetical protein
MRKPLVAGLLGAGIALTLLPTAPASAYCDSLTYALTGHCSNPCTITASAYYTADRVAKDLLPDVQFICLA